ncbi:MAG: hypothetical protein QOJ64_1879 [Acidobacteriota bacterium]|jgi:hypothetical protein|nr:hypothetical protein [Acidobacteriota bacterium]
MIKLGQTIELLAARGVEFVIVGGVAMTLHGSSSVTFDLDVCYARSNENLQRLVTALAQHQPRPRGLPEELPFVWEISTLRNGMNFTLSTDLGDLDLLGEVKGVGNYEEAREASVTMQLYGFECRVFTLDALIASKRAAGRPKDLLVLPELEALREIS